MYPQAAVTQLEEKNFKVSRLCDLVTNSKDVQNVMADRLTVFLHVNDTKKKFEDKARFLWGHAWCAIGIFHVADGQILEPSKWFHAVERVKNNAVLILGGQGDLEIVDVKGMGQKMTYLEVLPTSKVSQSI